VHSLGPSTVDENEKGVETMKINAINLAIRESCAGYIFLS
jgi:hypothetical protein